MEKKNYYFILDEKEYSIKIKIENNKLIIEVEENQHDIPFNYTLNLQFDEIKKINNIFLNMNSLEEIKIFLENIFSKKENIKAQIDELEEENIIISIDYDFFSMIKNLKLKFIKKIWSEKKMIEYLTNQNILLKKENLKLKNIIKSNGLSLDENKENKEQVVYNESKLITNDKEFNLIKSGIFNLNNKKIKLKLLYRASKDGDTPERFHSKCDGISPTISIFKTTDNFIFGGYSDKKWDNYSKDLKCNNCFLFSFNNMKIYSGKEGGSIYCSKNLGPWFFYALGVSNNSFLTEKEKHQLDFNTFKSYWNNFEKEYELTGGKKEFNVKEIEVFQVE